MSLAFLPLAAMFGTFLLRALAGTIAAVGLTYVALYRLRANAVFMGAVLALVTLSAVSWINRRTRRTP
jgi:hypothetical protein